MNIEKKMILGLSIICLISLSFNIYQDRFLNNEIKTRISTYKMLQVNEYIKNSSSNQGIYGVWFNKTKEYDGFYCVSYIPENDTDVVIHEKCHAHIDNDYYHFCEEYFNNQ
jgi:hypothetical protein